MGLLCGQSGLRSRSGCFIHVVFIHDMLRSEALTGFLFCFDFFHLRVRRRVRNRIALDVRRLTGSFEKTRLPLQWGEADQRLFLNKMFQESFSKEVFGPSRNVWRTAGPLCGLMITSLIFK